MFCLLLVNFCFRARSERFAGGTKTNSREWTRLDMSLDIFELGILASGGVQGHFIPLIQRQLAFLPFVYLDWLPNFLAKSEIDP
jgi:hypothetical protein